MTQPNKHIGIVELKQEEGSAPLLLVFDASAFAALESSWNLSMKGVINEIATWEEETLSVNKLIDLLFALAARHNSLTRPEAADLLGFPPNEVVMSKMMEAVELSLPKPPAGEAKLPAAQKKVKKSGTGTKP